MGGVDHADRLRALYDIDRKSRKWWHRLFFGLIDIMFVNSYVVYCTLFEKIPVLEYGRCERCEVCSNKGNESRPHSKCSYCKVHLCVNEKKLLF